VRSRPTDRRRPGARAGAPTPWPLAVPAAVGAVFLLLPLIALLARAPWRGLPRLLAGGPVAEALRLSLVSASAATAVSVLLGVPLAWVLARSRLPGTDLLRAAVTVPLVLPPVVGGLALLLALGRRGLAGQYLQAWWGWSLPFSAPAVVVAQTFVAMPFLVLTVEGAFRAADPGLDEAAATLGAGGATVFRRVTLPLVGPSLMAGTALCWARALGEFGATITFAGNFPGRTQTMPVAVYLALQTDPDAAVALSLVLLLVAVLVLTALRRHWMPRGNRTPGGSGTSRGNHQHGNFAEPVASSGRDRTGWR
jgi:molybdate transport system permease protein